jgi:2-iminobutanoate/2-iminopropanoate deaminase
VPDRNAGYILAYIRHEESPVKALKRVYECGALGEATRRSNIPLSIATSANGFVFISGLPALDWNTGELIKGDIATQTRAAMENLKRALEEAGSSLNLVVKATIFCTNVAYFKTINDIYRDYFPSDPPARSFVTVGSWPMEFDVEVEAIAVQGNV